MYTLEPTPNQHGKPHHKPTHSLTSHLNEEPTTELSQARCLVGIHVPAISSQPHTHSRHQ
ncbi:hypothetical protein BDV34DRAFT_190197 [Aspergillus parasiticus]|uniref:Uncharacterized protein n=1 Tax=Aspergillus parasiticus TaxID=5067 RepID=A0A5N6DW74_ASPPA|nr:hypothetical protein BDV34DRAFT_190197 [Aspergillus parasiticus]